MELHTLFKNLGLKSLSIQAIPGGLRHEAFRVQAANADYFVKVFTPEPSSLKTQQQDLERKESDLKILASQGHAVLVGLQLDNQYVHCWNDTLVIIYPFISGKTLEAHELSKQQIQQLAISIAKIHQGSTTTSLGYNRQGHERNWDKLEREIRTNDALNSLAAYVVMLKEWDHAYMALRSSRQLCNRRCHGDLHLGNLLWENDSLNIVDWEHTEIACSEAECIGIALDCSGIFTSSFNINITENFIKTYQTQTPFSLSIEEALAFWLGHSCATWSYEVLQQALHGSINQKKRYRQIALEHLLYSLKYLQLHLDTVRKLKLPPTI